MNQTVAGYITKELAAERLGNNIRYVEKLIASGELEGMQVTNPQTNRKQTIVSEKAIAQILAGRRGSALPPPRTSTKALPGPEAAAPAAAVPLTPWITIDQAAELSGLPASVLLGWIRSGKLKAADVGPRPGGRYRVRRVDVDALTADDCSVDNQE